MRRAKLPVVWVRRLWALPRSVLLRALLYTVIGTIGIGLGLPSILAGQTTMLLLWLAGPLAVLLFAGLSDVGELPPEQADNRASRGMNPDHAMAAGFTALGIMTVISGLTEISKLQSYSMFYLLLPICVVLFGLITSSMMARPLWLALSRELGVDEAGVRLHRRGASSYWPFPLLRDAKLVRRGPVPKLVLRDRTGRVVVELPLLGKQALERGKELAEEIQDGIDAATESHAPPEELLRGDRGMDEWLDDSRRLLETARAGGYRARVSEEQLLGTLDDASAPVDARAAAAHALLTAGSPKLRVETKLRIGPGSPPLVQLAARLSDEGRELVSDEEMEDALRSLDALDHDEAAKLLEERQSK